MADLPESSANNAHKPSSYEVEGQRATSFAELSDMSKLALLNNNGYLTGVNMSNIDGPRKAPNKVALLKSRTRVYTSEMDEIITDITTTQNHRETNYVHQGWSLPALASISPWTESRIANARQKNGDADSITKSVVVQRLRIDIPLNDIQPATEFEADMEDALKQPSLFEISKAIGQALNNWGDVVPLVFDLGTSITVTDSKSNIEQKAASESSYFGLGQLTASSTGRILTKGGDTTLLGQGVSAWLHSPVPVSRWTQVRIISAVSVIDLLPQELQARIEKLRDSLVTYYPLNLEKFTSDSSSFDDLAHAIKIIKSVTLRASDYICSIVVNYCDGSVSATHGSVGTGVEHVFELRTEEHIVEMIVWNSDKGVCALQFITSKGRISQSYGGGGGTPSFMRSKGGLLTAFSGQTKDDRIQRIQGIWRHDVQLAGAYRERDYSRHYGGTGGRSFNDGLLVENSSLTRVSGIRLWCGDYVSGIQLICTSEKDGQLTKLEGPHYGGTQGEEKTFDLDPGEHIVLVAGRQNAWIVRLCFVTNFGRASPVFGGGQGHEFICRAPRASDGQSMRLNNICGRSDDNWVIGLVFVWSPV